MAWRSSWSWAAPALVTAALALPAAAQDRPQPADEEAGAAAAETGEPATGLRLDWGFEARAHYRDSEANRFPVSFPFTPAQLPVGQTRAFEETVNSGQHFELSVLSLFLDAAFVGGDGRPAGITAHAKIDFVDLYDRNPTSSDRQVDVDEAWLRFGRESEPAVAPERPGAYLKLGKMPKLERQDDRHLESYGLVSTAFNRFEDIGLELGVDLGRWLYLKGTATQGNPVFLRDPNALAGDNGTPIFLRPFPNPDPTLKSGIVIPYDAEVEGLDADGDLELGAAIGGRWSDAAGGNGCELMVWGYQRDLADTVELEGSFYGGDLDLLRGPGNAFPFPLDGRRKREVGANLWLYLGGFTLFSQYVDQDLAGLPRKGYEVEAAWRFDLPLAWAAGGQQLFPWIAPAVRFSELDPGFRAPPLTPSPSFAWDWQKTDLGVRLGIVRGIDLTVEYSRNDFTLASGASGSNDEVLATLRWKR